MRIGVFGGTFNPPHQGHKKLALEFMSRLSLDLMYIIPTFIPPHKQADDLATGEDRLNMCRLCFSEKAFHISDMELLREGKSYTVDTLRELKEKHPEDELFFIMGSDMLLTFHQWRDPEGILDYAVICAATRESGLTGSLTEYVENNFSHRKNRFRILDFVPVEISSSEIREDIDEAINDDILSPEVEDYIKERGLYL